MKKIIMILLVVFGLGVGSRAQAQMLNLNYQMSLPLGDQHDFISKMSFRGFSMDYHYFLSERLEIEIIHGKPAWDGILCISIWIMQPVILP